MIILEKGQLHEETDYQDKDKGDRRKHRIGRRVKSF